MSDAREAQRAIARARLQLWRDDPVVMVREEFNVEPDEWQKEALRAYAKHNRLAMKACKGPGKTTVEAWIILNFLATRPKPKIGATSITGDNLAMNLWPELHNWMDRSRFFSATFLWTKTRVEHREHGADWFCEARTWPKKADKQQQADALAGLHADYAMWVLDESGGIPQAVMTTAEAVLASGIETKVVQAGNPTHREGPLYMAAVTHRHLWQVVTITGDPDDPKRSPRIKEEWAREQIATYGRENPWVKVNVLGEFPESSINQLLGEEEVEAAMKRHLREDVYNWSQKRLGIDVARFGDDRTVIFPRQGLAAFRPIVMRNVRTTNIAARVAHAKRTWKSEVEFVDDTGHWGHGVIDNLITAGIGAVPVVFSDPAINPRYRNRRAEMWMEMADWVKKGAALPYNVEMIGELVTPTYTFVGGKFVLEEKDQIKERLGRSPDLADALALTFAMPDMPGQMTMPGISRKTEHVAHDGDPFAGLETGASRDWDPYA